MREAELAATYWHHGRWKEAEALGVRVIETTKRVLGEEHPDTLTSMNNLAFTLKDQSRDAEAISLTRRCCKLGMQVLGPGYPHTEASLEALHEWEGGEDELELPQHLIGKSSSQSTYTFVQSMDNCQASVRRNVETA